MTDDLERELRALLARRAGEVRSDAAAGEREISRRLIAGDRALDAALGRARPRRWLAVAAMVVAVAGVGVLLAQGDDPTVSTEPPVADTSSPEPTTLEGKALNLTFFPALDAFPCSDDVAGWPDVAQQRCFRMGPVIDLAGVIESVGTATAPDGTTVVRVVLTPAGIERFNEVAAKCFERGTGCPTGQIAVMSNGVVISAPSVQLPAYERDQIQLSVPYSASDADALIDQILGIDQPFGPPGTPAGSLECEEDEVAESSVGDIAADTVGFPTPQAAIDEHLRGHILPDMPPTSDDAVSSRKVDPGRIIFEVTVDGRTRVAVLVEALEQGGWFATGTARCQPAPR